MVTPASELGASTVEDCLFALQESAEFGAVLLRHQQAGGGEGLGGRPGRNTQLRQEIDELFDRRGLPLPANIIECSTILTLKPVLVETDAVAPLPMLIGARDPLLDVLPWHWTPCRARSGSLRSPTGRRPTAPVS
ncbi:type 2 periplasmic-binding domain-containing protein [Streptomyces sp. UC4497]